MEMKEVSGNVSSPAVRREQKVHSEFRTERIPSLSNNLKGDRFWCGLI